MATLTANQIQSMTKDMVMAAYSRATNHRLKINLNIVGMSLWKMTYFHLQCLKAWLCTWRPC